MHALYVVHIPEWGAVLLHMLRLLRLALTQDRYSTFNVASNLGYSQLTKSSWFLEVVMNQYYRASFRNQILVNPESNPDK